MIARRLASVEKLMSEINEPVAIAASWTTIPIAANQFQLPESTIRTLVRRGHVAKRAMPGSKTGILVRRTDIETYIAGRRVRTLLTS